MFKIYHLYVFFVPLPAAPVLPGTVGGCCFWVWFPLASGSGVTSGSASTAAKGARFSSPAVESVEIRLSFCSASWYGGELQSEPKSVLIRTLRYEKTALTRLTFRRHYPCPSSSSGRNCTRCPLRSVDSLLFKLQLTIDVLQWMVRNF